MKKLFILFVLSFSIMLIPFLEISAITADTMNLNIKFDDSTDNEIIVVVPDDDNYATLKPEISVNTDYSSVKVEKDGTAVDFEFDSGVVTFVIDDSNCTYIITNTAISSSATKPYKAPKTCVE